MGNNLSNPKKYILVDPLFLLPSSNNKNAFISNDHIVFLFYRGTIRIIPSVSICLNIFRVRDAN